MAGDRGDRTMAAGVARANYASRSARRAVAGGAAYTVERGNQVAMEEATAAADLHRRIRQLEQQIEKERRRWGAQLARLEAQLAELRKLIEAQR